MKNRLILNIIAIFLVLFNILCILKVFNIDVLKLDRIVSTFKTHKNIFFTSLSEKKEEVEKEIEEARKNSEEIKASINNTVSEALNLQAQISQKEIEIEQLQNETKSLEQQSEELQKKVEDEKNKKDSMDKVLKSRLRAMYLTKKYSKLEILLKSKNIMEIFSNYYMLSQISKVDSQTVRSVENTKRKFENTYKEYDTIKSRIVEKKSQIEQSKIAQENLVKMKNARVQELKVEEANVYEKMAKLENDRLELEREIEREASRMQHIDRYVGGTFAWPVPACNSTGWITAYYGENWASGYPGAGHSGVDIAIPSGSVGSIQAVAAQDGRVLISSYGYNGGYGNYIMIDHGGGIYSIYGHANSLLVAPGQYVRRGQPILYVGSTGYSTGPHLHFEMRIGGYTQGYRVNPLPYITTNAQP